MAALGSNAPIKMVGHGRIKKILLGGTVYSGSILEWTATANVAAALATSDGSEDVAGIALEPGVSGDYIEVLVDGEIESGINVTAAAANVGAVVYATTDNVQDCTLTSTNACAIGAVTQVIVTGTLAAGNKLQIRLKAGGY